MILGLIASPLVSFLWAVASSIYWRKELQHHWLFAFTVFMLGLGANTLITGAWQSYEAFGNVIFEIVPPSEMANHLMRLQRVAIIHAVVSLVLLVPLTSWLSNKL